MESLTAGAASGRTIPADPSAGQGRGSGEVWLAEETDHARRFALKFPHGGRRARRLLARPSSSWHGGSCIPASSGVHEFVRWARRHSSCMQYVHGTNMAPARRRVSRHRRRDDSGGRSARIRAPAGRHSPGSQGLQRPARSSAARCLVADFGLGGAAQRRLAAGMSPQQLDGRASRGRATTCTASARCYTT